jgi:phosphatidylserine/phosphatidylglycerophosphate/cardiolipin synthase-like enzyme
VPAANYHGAVHYGPGENLEVVDVAAIVNSRCDHLDIAMYSFTDWELAQAVTRFAAKGRRVRIYRDRDQYEQESRRSSYVANLFHGNRNIAIRVKGSMILMHDKAWSDGCMLREGSANWSPSGEIKQDNTLTLTADSDTIRAFETNFQAMWARPDNEVIQ